MLETVDVYVMIYDGLPFPIGEACLSVRPNEDEAFPWGITADVQYQDIRTDKWHSMPEHRANAILADIRKNDKEKWADMERAARLNSRPDFDEDREPIHWAEDEFAALECPR